MKSILKTIQFEFENLFFNITLWIMIMIYTLICLLICISDDIRNSYFSTIDSMPVMLNDSILPVIIILILIFMLSPTFSGDIEYHTKQIPMTCVIGYKGRNIARLVSSVLFSAVIIIFLEIITLVCCMACNIIDFNQEIKYVGTEIVLYPIWTVFRHIIFGAICIIIGSIILTLLILYISCVSKSILESLSVTTVIIMIEFMFNRFSFPAILQEYNIFVFFRPYYFFVMEIINVSPLVNFFILSLAFLPLNVIFTHKIICHR